MPIIIPTTENNAATIRKTNAMSLSKDITEMNSNTTKEKQIQTIANNNSAIDCIIPLLSFLSI
jgi:hypothetical protein